VLVDGGACPEHRRAFYRDQNQQRRLDPVQRERDAFYKTAAWRRLRAWRLAVEPLCRACKSRGLVVAGTEVDHIEPVSVAWDRRLDESNTQSLCGSCHAEKSAVEGSRWGGVQKATALDGGTGGKCRALSREMGRGVYPGSDLKITRATEPPAVQSAAPANPEQGSGPTGRRKRG
jgi:hypothetical protein